MMYATTCPAVMNSVDTVTNRPLHMAGLISLIYSGTTKLALPTAKPMTDRPKIMPHTVEERACHTAPMMKSASAMRMTRLRPSPSARSPEKGEASSAKRDVEEVIKDLSIVVRAREERSAFIETRVDEITPVLSVDVNILSCNEYHGVVSSHPLKANLESGGERTSILITKQQSTDAR
jgi:hypothetical protein